MPIHVLAKHYALKNHILQVRYNWIILKLKNVQKIKVYDPSYTVKILVPDSGTRFFQLVPAKQIDLPHQLRTQQTANKMLIYGLVTIKAIKATCGSELTISIFHMKKCIGCGYSLEAPQWDNSKEYM